MVTVRLENVRPETNTRKFWQATIDGTSVIVQWGRIGTEGQSKPQQFGNSGGARQFVEDMTREKISRGYVLTARDESAGVAKRYALASEVKEALTQKRPLGRGAVAVPMERASDVLASLRPANPKRIAFQKPPSPPAPSVVVSPKRETREINFDDED